MDEDRPLRDEAVKDRIRRAVEFLDPSAWFPVMLPTILY